MPDDAAKTWARTREYRVVKGAHGRPDPETGANQVYGPGSTMRLTEEEAARLGDRVVAVEGGAVAPSSQTTMATAASNTLVGAGEGARVGAGTGEGEGTGSTDQYDPAPEHWQSVKAHVAGLDDAAEVQRIRDAEAEGKGRQSVLDAADERLKELGA